MKNNNNLNSILIAVISGIVVCLVCVGVLFLTSSSEKNNLKGNSKLQEQYSDVNDERNLGDVCVQSHYSCNGIGGILHSSGCYYTAGDYGPGCQGIDVDDKCYVFIASASLVCDKYCSSYSMTSADLCAQEAQDYCAPYGFTGCNTADSNGCYTYTCNSAPPVTSCDPGYYVSSNSCKICPSGKRCAGGISQPVDCEAGTYSGTGASSCTNCLGGTYSSAGASKCETCPAGTYSKAKAATCSKCKDLGDDKYSNAGASQCLTCENGPSNAAGTGCVNSTSSGCSAGQWRGQNSCETCPKGYKCPDNIKKVACDGAKEYQDETGQTYCKTCSTGKTPNESHTGCVNVPTGCSSTGKYLDDNGTCQTCPAGYFCYNYAKTACPAGTSSEAGKSAVSDCKTCDDGYISSAGGLCTKCTAVNQTSNADHTSCTCLPGYSYVNAICSNQDWSQCDVTATTTSKHTSKTDLDDPKQDENSYYTVTVTVTGSGCAGQNLEFSASNAKLVTPNIATVTGPGSFSFVVYPKTKCVKSVAQAKLSKNGKIAHTSSVSLMSDWKRFDNQCEANPAYTSFQAADDDGKDVYYEDYGACSDPTKQGYRVKWERYWCDDGGSASESSSTATYDYCCVKNDSSSYIWMSNQTKEECSPNYIIDYSKTETTCQKANVSACYKDSDNNYYWTDNPASSWIKVDGITKEKNCKKEETPACYKDLKGEYKWGKYATNDGYTLITSIKDEDSCKKPTNEACYKNDKNDYVWAESAPEGYTKVDGVGKPEDCGPEENPACYLHGKEFVWGKYSNVNGYIFIENITDEKNCKAPLDEACYKDPDGDYVWGEYSNDEGFTLVPNITEMSQCGVDVPTPKTGIDVQNIVYIFMAVLMAFGIGFIYYSANIKKYNQ